MTRADRAQRRAGGRRDRAGRPRRRPSCSRPTAREAAADELNAFIWVADEARRRRRGARRCAASRSPSRTSSAPRACRPGGLEDPRGLPAALHRDRGRAARGRRRAAAGQDQPGRVRDGLVERELAASGRSSTRGTARACPGGSQRRQRRRRRRGHRAVGAGHRHRRLDPPARRAVRDRRPQADLRQRQPLRDDRLRLVAGPGRPAHARRHRRGAAVRPHDRAATRATRRRVGHPEARSCCRPPSASTASASACRRT